MMTLLKKDWWLLRMGTIGAVSVLVLVYLIAGITLLNLDRGIRPGDIPETFFNAGMIGIVISAIVSAMYGSGTFALERHDRSADFLAMIPVERWKILASKAIVTIGCSLVFWLIHFAVMMIFSFRTDQFPTHMDEEYLRGFVVMIFGINVLFFCTAWFFSTFLPSAVISIVAAIIFCAAMLTILGSWIHHRNPYTDERSANALMDAWTYGVGMACFIAGVIYYPRRIAP